MEESPHRLSALAERWAPAVVLADIAIAALGWFTGWVPTPVPYALAVMTGAAVILLVIRWLQTIGARSSEELGFRRYRDVQAYDWFGRGYRDETWMLIGASFVAIALFYGEGALTVMGVTAFALANAWAAVTRRYPADEDGAI